MDELNQTKLFCEKMIAHCQEHKKTCEQNGNHHDFIWWSGAVTAYEGVLKTIVHVEFSGITEDIEL